MSPEIVGHAGPLFDPHYPEVRIVWDASTLSALARNPYTYYWQYVLGRRLTGWQTYAAFGTAWHLLCEAYWQSQRNLHLAWAQLPFEMLDTLDATGARSAFALFRALVWYDRWNARLPQGLGETIEIEQKFCYTVPDLYSPALLPYKLAGAVDQVVRRADGSIWLVERKSGVAIPTAGMLLKRYRTQLEVYMLHGRLRYGVDFGGVCVDGMQTAVTFSDFSRFDIADGSGHFDSRHTWEMVKWRIDFAQRLALQKAWHLAARTDDPYASRELSDIMQANPILWDRLMTSATVQEALWYPGTDR